MSYFKEKSSLPKHILVFDIETVKDTSFIDSLLDKTFSSDEERQKAISEYTNPKREDGKDFDKHIFHKVVCVSFLLLKVEYAKNDSFQENSKENYKIVKLESYSLKDFSEEEIIRKFWDNFNKTTLRLVSFNGRSFDIAVLKYRAMKYNISTECYFAFGGKWENYHGRYACISFRDNLSYHFDILEAITEFGSSSKVKLQEIAAMLGIPAKLGNDEGGNVQKLFNENKLDDIIDYCETDVLATYLVYLKFLIINGKIDKENLFKHFENLKIFLEDFYQNNSSKTRIKEFLERWKF